MHVLEDDVCRLLDKGLRRHAWDVDLSLLGKYGKHAPCCGTEAAIRVEDEWLELRTLSEGGSLVGVDFVPLPLGNGCGTWLVRSKATSGVGVNERDINIDDAVKRGRETKVCSSLGFLLRRHAWFDFCVDASSASNLGSQCVDQCVVPHGNV